MLTITGTSDELTIDRQFSTNTSLQVEEIAFADGTVWTPTTTPMLRRGTPATETMIGTAGPDVFEGLAGNDTILGGAGNDTYRFYRGDGQDTITDNDSTPGNVDKVLFAADIQPSEVSANRSGNNLVLTLGASDRVTVTNYFLNEGVTPYAIEQIKFLYDGTVWDLDAVKPRVLVGTAGNDSILGFMANDTLSGFGGDDTLAGAGGNDTLDGGTGNDLLYGSFSSGIYFAGNDTYLIARGDGQDTIIDPDSSAANVDTVVYAADISPAEITARRSGDSLVLSLSGTSDQLTVTAHFGADGTGPYSVEQIRFLADGTVWDVNTLKQMVLTGTEGADTLVGFTTNDVLTGFGGNDTLTGNAGADTLDGGTGNDSMLGGAGNDTYRIFRGDAQDTVTDQDSTSGNVDRVVYAPDISPSDVRAVHSGNNLVLSLAGTGDQVTITNHFENDGATPYSVERIEFEADGTVWDANAVKTMVVTPTSGDDAITGFSTSELLSGLAGNDTLRGVGGDDTLDGGTGNDTLYGGGGSDTYLFARGSGQETIFNLSTDGPGLDVLLFASDIAPADVSIASSYPYDLVLTVAATPDQVRLRDYLFGDWALTEEIRFADGTVWSESYIATLFPVGGTAGNDNLSGTGLSDSIQALAGDDTVHGANGNDTIDGGVGADTLYGDAGADVLLAGPDTGNNAAGNTLYGGVHSDILIGAAGNDWLEDFNDNNLLAGSDGDDNVRIGRQNDLVIGGRDADTIIGNRAIDGKDVFLFNKGDGKDQVVDLGYGSTISIGGGLYSNLKLAVSGLGLVLKVGTSSITLADWYRTATVGVPPYKRIANLQVVIDGTRNYDPTSADPMRNQKVQVFDFFGLVAAFDAARAAGQRFNVADNLPAFRLWGSDTDAYGGAVAYEYAVNGLIDTLSTATMQAVITAPEFAQLPQPIAGAVAASSSISASVSAEDTGLAAHEVVSLRDLITVSHPEGRGPTRLQVWDDSASGGFFLVNGVEQPAGRAIDVDPAEITLAAYVGGAAQGAEQVWARAFDGSRWGAWTNWLMSTESGLLSGGAGPDALYGDADTPVLEGGAGDDALFAGETNSLLHAGTGDDNLLGTGGNDLLVGGTGNDTIHTGAGANVVSFNAGGGVDSVYSSSGAANTLSFGGGLRYSDLSLSKDGDDLIVNTGGTDKVVLKDWYGGGNNVLTLQLILDATDEFDAGSADSLYNKRVQTFDFLGMVSQFDQARAQSPGLTSWALTNALLQYHLAGADDAALGGDLAYWYGKNDALTGISLTAALDVLASGNFGAEAQQLRPWSGLQEGYVKLS
ncbi:MAG: calcium-binding protein [Candidatus Binatia bacterium]